MPRVRISAEASQELEEAVAWYENERPGLGVKLVEAFENAITLLESDLPPLAAMPGAAGQKGAKRLLLHRFPFSLVTIEKSNERIVLALAHQSRRPGYWKERPIQ